MSDSDKKLSQIKDILNQTKLTNDEIVEKIKVIIYDTEHIKKQLELFNPPEAVKPLVEKKVKELIAPKKNKIINNEVNFEEGNEDINVENINELGEGDISNIELCIECEKNNLDITKNKKLNEYFEVIKNNYKLGVYTNIEVEELDKINLFKEWRTTKAKHENVKLSFKTGILLCRQYEKENKKFIAEDTIYRGVNVGYWFKRHKNDGEKNVDKSEELKKIKSYFQAADKKINNSTFEENIAKCIEEETKRSIAARGENKKPNPNYTFITTQKNRYKLLFESSSSARETKKEEKKEKGKRQKILAPLTNSEIDKLLSVNTFKNWKELYDVERTK